MSSAGIPRRSPGSAACRTSPRFRATWSWNWSKTLAMPEVRKRFDELGLEPVGNTPAEFASVIKKEMPEWAKVIKDAGIKLGN